MKDLKVTDSAVYYCALRAAVNEAPAGLKQNPAQVDNQWFIVRTTHGVKNHRKFTHSVRDNTAPSECFPSLRLMIVIVGKFDIFLLIWLSDQVQSFTDPIHTNMQISQMNNAINLYFKCSRSFNCLTDHTFQKWWNIKGRLRVVTCWSRWVKIVDCKMCTL